MASLFSKFLQHRWHSGMDTEIQTTLARLAISLIYLRLIGFPNMSEKFKDRKINGNLSTSKQAASKKQIPNMYLALNIQMAYEYSHIPSENAL